MYLCVTILIFDCGFVLTSGICLVSHLITIRWENREITYLKQQDSHSSHLWSLNPKIGLQYI